AGAGPPEHTVELADLSDPTDGVGLAAAVAARRRLELDSVALVQGAETLSLDRAVVDEDVRPAIGGDEAEALLRVEPLDRALGHGTSMLQYCGNAVVLLTAPTLPQIAAAVRDRAARSGRIAVVVSSPRTVDEHRAVVAALLDPMPAEDVPVVHARGRVLADVGAGGALPSFDDSALDGYAVRAADWTDAPVELPVEADIPAGRTDVPPLRPGTAHRIMTGALVPPGADAVVPVEQTDGGL